jgi:hypothetical protein
MTAARAGLAWAGSLFGFTHGENSFSLMLTKLRDILSN